ncbi:MAG: DUF5329 domain-containing protein [Prevotellaceae bacterium]|nr:DUF5329 domain-containing protein [Prevotellaceae bacterium]
MKILYLIITLTIFVFGSLTLSAKKTLTESEKIEELIKSMERLGDVEFIRNGKSYKAGKAVSHLRSKLKRAGEKVKTVQDFIDGIASSSYFTGNPYYIKFNDGKQVALKEFFEARLKELE